MGWVMFRIGVSKCAVHVPNRIGKAGPQSMKKLREHNTIKKVILLGILPHIGPINQPKFKHNIPDRGSRDPTLLWSY